MSQRFVNCSEPLRKKNKNNNNNNHLDLKRITKNKKIYMKRNHFGGRGDWGEKEKRNGEEDWRKRENREFFFLTRRRGRKERTEKVQRRKE